MTQLGLVGALISAGFIGLLAFTDPKRRGLGNKGRNRFWRSVFIVGSLLPGFWLGCSSRWPDFLIWIGSTAIIGWGTAGVASLARRNESKQLSRKGVASPPYQRGHPSS